LRSHCRPTRGNRWIV